MNKVPTYSSIPKAWESANAILQTRIDSIATLANELEWTVEQKASNETRASTSTYADDASLVFGVAEASRYAFRAVVFFDTSAAADFKYQVQGPASPTLVRYEVKHIAPGTTAYAGQAVQTAFAQSTAITGAGTTGGFVEINGIVHNGVNGGIVRIQWAQNTLDASNTTVLAGSYLEWMQF